MASTTSHRILLVTNEEATSRPDNEDYTADVVITPGELLQFDSSNGLDPHGTADGWAQKVFALEKVFDGGQDANQIDIDYAIDEAVRIVFCQPGDIVYAWGTPSLEALEGETPLVSDGLGAFKASAVNPPDATTIADAVIAVPMETKTVGGGGRERLKVRIL